MSSYLFLNHHSLQHNPICRVIMLNGAKSKNVPTLTDRCVADVALPSDTASPLDAGARLSL